MNQSNYNGYINTSSELASSRVSCYQNLALNTSSISESDNYSNNGGSAANGNGGTLSLLKQQCAVLIKNRKQSKQSVSSSQQVDTNSSNYNIISSSNINNNILHSSFINEINNPRNNNNYNNPYLENSQYGLSSDNNLNQTTNTLKIADLNLNLNTTAKNLEKDFQLCQMDISQTTDLKNQTSSTLGKPNRQIVLSENRRGRQLERMSEEESQSLNSSDCKISNSMNHSRDNLTPFQGSLNALVITENYNRNANTCDSLNTSNIFVKIGVASDNMNRLQNSLQSKQNNPHNFREPLVNTTNVHHNNNKDLKYELEQININSQRQISNKHCESISSQGSLVSNSSLYGIQSYAKQSIHQNETEQKQIDYNQPRHSTINLVQNNQSKFECHNIFSPNVNTNSNGKNHLHEESIQRSSQHNTSMQQPMSLNTSHSGTGKTTIEYKELSFHNPQVFSLMHQQQIYSPNIDTLRHVQASGECPLQNENNIDKQSQNTQQVANNQAEYALYLEQNPISYYRKQSNMQYVKTQQEDDESVSCMGGMDIKELDLKLSPYDQFRSLSERVEYNQQYQQRNSKPNQYASSEQSQKVSEQLLLLEDMTFQQNVKGDDCYYQYLPLQKQDNQQRSSPKLDLNDDMSKSGFTLMIPSNLNLSHLPIQQSNNDIHSQHGTDMNFQASLIIANLQGIDHNYPQEQFTGSNTHTSIVAADQYLLYNEQDFQHFAQQKQSFTNEPQSINNTQELSFKQLKEISMYSNDICQGGDETDEKSLIIELIKIPQESKTSTNVTATQRAQIKNEDIKIIENRHETSTQSFSNEEQRILSELQQLDKHLQSIVQTKTATNTNKKHESACSTNVSNKQALKICYSKLSVLTQQTQQTAQSRVTQSQRSPIGIPPPVDYLSNEQQIGAMKKKMELLEELHSQRQIQQASENYDKLIQKVGKQVIVTQSSFDREFERDNNEQPNYNFVSACHKNQVNNSLMLNLNNLTSSYDNQEQNYHQQQMKIEDLDHSNNGYERNQQDQQEVRMLGFQPLPQRRSQARLSKQHKSKGEKSLENFLRRQINWLDNKNVKVEQRKEQVKEQNETSEMTECTFKPKIKKIKNESYNANNYTLAQKNYGHQMKQQHSQVMRQNYHSSMSPNVFKQSLVGKQSVERVEDRLISWEHRVKLKQQQFKKDLHREFKRECPFKPNLSPLAKVQRDYSNDAPRSISDNNRERRSLSCKKDRLKSFEQKGVAGFSNMMHQIKEENRSITGRGQNDNSKTRFNMVEFYQRNLNWRSKVETHKQLIIKEKQLKEEKENTFKPQICNMSEAIHKKKIQYLKQTKPDGDGSLYYQAQVFKDIQTKKQPKDYSPVLSERRLQKSRSKSAKNRKQETRVKQIQQPIQPKSKPQTLQNHQQHARAYKSSEKTQTDKNTETKSTKLEVALVDLEKEKHEFEKLIQKLSHKILRPESRGFISDGKTPALNEIIQTQASYFGDYQDKELSVDDLRSPYKENDKRQDQNQSKLMQESESSPFQEYVRAFNIESQKKPTLLLADSDYISNNAGNHVGQFHEDTFSHRNNDSEIEETQFFSCQQNINYSSQKTKQNSNNKSYTIIMNQKNHMKKQQQQQQYQSRTKKQTRPFYQKENQQTEDCYALDQLVLKQNGNKEVESERKVHPNKCNPAQMNLFSESKRSGVFDELKNLTLRLRETLSHKESECNNSTTK
ncbi:UNKNOWN [Stylonychia lemnae]|uniref:Uncharacterized protein n=1 Tax=Stylonychia lemnae TaxID=5949 RepID=A0A078AZA8_STYLE|nr:UNKNOWN [Stylonychia lemnae]|eukprot:CDW86148.1 UNKNOWN [Stylonychia lemnae]